MAMFLDAVFRELGEEINRSPLLVFLLLILLATAMMGWAAVKGRAVFFVLWLAIWLGSIWSLGPIVDAIIEGR